MWIRHSNALDKYLQLTIFVAKKKSICSFWSFSISQLSQTVAKIPFDNEILTFRARIVYKKEIGPRATGSILSKCGVIRS